MIVFRPTLYVSILTFFMVILVVSGGTLTWYNHERDVEAALHIADSLMTEVDERALEQIDAMFGDTFRLAHETAELSLLDEKPVFMRHGAQWFMAEALLVHPHLYSAYIGYADGDFYQVVSLLHSKPELRDKIGAPDDAILAVRRVFSRPSDGRRVELWLFFDSERRIVGSRAVGHSRYDPRGRPWFKLAANSEAAIHTPFYLFDSTGSLGLSVARRFDGTLPGVIGVDITLDELSSFFARQHVGQSGLVFMFDQTGHLTAHPDPKMTVYGHLQGGQTAEQVRLDETGDPLLAALAKRLDQGDMQPKMEFKGPFGRYLMHVTPVRDERLGDQYVAVAAKTSEFTGPIDQTRRKSLMFALVMALLSVPLCVYFSRRISTPLRKLAKEADEIRHFNLDSPVDITSRVAEIADLTEAVKTMKSSLDSFGQYVPKALVRQLLLSQVEPEIGGERRELTILFTDIINFSSIAESMEPEELMMLVSEYLAIMAFQILQLEGTIDKFLGDGIMAFWNAPVLQPDHATMACEATLRARQANRAMNNAFAKKGIPLMRTRYGLHTGDAIIGNIGSEDRLNYTTMGEAVNLASRLEGLNERYGTEILVSETVRERTGDQFVFRSVGLVQPVGSTKPIRVYELLGRADSCEIAVSPPQRICELAEEWEKAHQAYRGRRFDEAAALFSKLSATVPEDRLAAIMLERSRMYQTAPPGEDWDGVDVFTSK